MIVALAMPKPSRALGCHAYQRVLTLDPPRVVTHLIHNLSDDVDGATEFIGQPSGHVTAHHVTRPHRSRGGHGRTPPSRGQYSMAAFDLRRRSPMW